ncbi:MAG: ABC transporter ATP-binding protein [Microlunatus sp.]|nr:ABC transporter ATP-binding protein [Microlunatus sp.]
MTTQPDTRPAPATADPYLVVDQLQVRFPTHDGEVRAVAGLSYSLPLGRTLGIVGESGSGKSVSVMALLGLHDARTAKISGSITIGGTEIVGASESTLNQLRGKDVAMVFQDAMTALHPFFTIGAQISEAYRLHHHGVGKKRARARAIEMLDLVGIPDPARRVDDYPHQFSGGMRQRAMIAIALVNNPRLLIADEPTTALDVTVQAQILDLLIELQTELGSSMIMITHDLGVVAEVADDVLVMYGGYCVEKGSREQILGGAKMPYTWDLLATVPDPTSDPSEPLTPIPGSPPSLLHPPPGCPYHARCRYNSKISERCASTLPDLIPVSGDGHLGRCHLLGTPTPDGGQP